MLAAQKVSPGVPNPPQLDPCRPRPGSSRRVEPYIPSTAAAPLHPNIAGMPAMSQMVVDAG